MKTGSLLLWCTAMALLVGGCSQETESDKEKVLPPPEVQGSLIERPKPEERKAPETAAEAQDGEGAEREIATAAGEEPVSLLSGSIIGGGDSPAPEEGAEVDPRKNQELGVVAEAEAWEMSEAAEAAEAGPELERTQKAPEQIEVADGESEFKRISFEQLASFEFDVPEGPVTNEVGAAETESDSGQIPEDVRALNDQRVALRGFMLPLKVEKGLVTELLLMRDQSMCCYGTVPKINEWVSVKMSEKGVKAVMDQPVTLFGTLHVGEMRENGYLVGIYEMEGEELAGPLDL